MNNLTNFKSLTSRTLERMMESELFVAPRSRSRFSELSSSLAMQPAQSTSDSLIEAYLNGSVDRPFYVYHLHNVISAIARAVVTIAINVFVAPVGLIYHTSQALYHRNISELRHRHLACAKVELIRVIALANIVSRVAFPRLYLVPISGVAEVGRSLIVLSLLAAFFAILLDTMSTLSANLGYNSRYLDDNNGNWLAEMALKWELGVPRPGTTKQFLEAIISTTSDKLQEAVNHLHTALETEGKCKLKGPQVTSDYLLHFLKTNLDRYKGSKEWNKITQYRDEVLRYTTLTYRLNHYTEFFPRRPLVRPQDQTKSYSDNKWTNDSDHKWISDLSNVKKAILDIGAEASTDELYRTFKDRVFTLKATQKTIFGYAKLAAIKPSELKKTHRKLALILHPDKQGESSEKLKNEATELFKILSNAFEFLNDPNNNQLIEESLF